MNNLQICLFETLNEYTPNNISPCNTEVNTLPCKINNKTILLDNAKVLQLKGKVKKKLRKKMKKKILTNLHKKKIKNKKKLKKFKNLYHSTQNTNEPIFPGNNKDSIFSDNVKKKEIIFLITKHPKNQGKTKKISQNVEHAKNVNSSNNKSNVICNINKNEINVNNYNTPINSMQCINSLNNNLDYEIIFNNYHEQDINIYDIYNTDLYHTPFQ